MNGFGGIVGFGEGVIDSCELINMSRAAAIGSRGRSESFVSTRGALFCNSHDGEREALPYICTRKGAEFALAFDGELDARGVMENYFIGGIESLTETDGAFALALYDGERGRLILLRGKKGSAPLFFSHSNGTVRFASKVFSLLSSDAEFDIDKNALAAHITAPAGAYGVGDIYKGIFELSACECAVFTSLGVSRFAFSPAAQARHTKSYSIAKKEKRIVSPHLTFSPDTLGACLSDALVAFGYPQFDFLMPSFCKSFATAARQGREKLFFYDPTRRESPRYAEERASRLGALYGLRAVGVLCRADVQYPLDELSGMQRALWRRVSSMPPNRREALDSVLGKQEYTKLLKALLNDVKRAESGTAVSVHAVIRNIRTLGLLWQTADMLAGDNF